LWLNVDVDGSGGSEGGGSRMKGKRKKKDSWLDEWKGKTHHDAVRKNCGAHSTLAQIFEGIRDRRASLFPSPVHNPTLHLLGGLNLPVPEHHHSLLIIVHGKVICCHRCEVVVIHNACDWDIRG
jgi:hypothetical protein